MKDGCIWIHRSKYKDTSSPLIAEVWSGNGWEELQSEEITEDIKEILDDIEVLSGEVVGHGQAIDALELKIVELEEEIIDLQAQDPEIKYGQPRELMGHGTPQESNVPDNWVQLADGGFNWIGKPAYVGQRYYDQDNSTGSGSAWMGYLKSDYTLDWKAIN
jgi:hypothetical protein